MLLVIDSRGDFAKELAPHAEELKIIFARNAKHITQDLPYLNEIKTIIVPHTNVKDTLQKQGIQINIIQLNYRFSNIEDVKMALIGKPKFGAYIEDPMNPIYGSKNINKSKVNDREKDAEKELPDVTSTKDSKNQHKSQKVQQTPLKSVQHHEKQTDDKSVTKDYQIKNKKKDSDKPKTKIVESVLPMEIERVQDGRLGPGREKIKQVGRDGYIKQEIDIASGKVLRVIEMIEMRPQVVRYNDAKPKNNDEELITITEKVPEEYPEPTFVSENAVVFVDSPKSNTLDDSEKLPVFSDAKDDFAPSFTDIDELDDGGLKFIDPDTDS